MKRSRSALLFALASASCSGEERKSFTPSFAPDIEYAAILTFDSSGELSGASGIVDWREKQKLELLRVPEDKVATIVAIGWRAGELAPIVLPRPDILESSPLGRAVECDPKLPAPFMSLVLEGSRLEDVGPLSAVWLADLCPQVQDTTFVDVDCYLLRCIGGFEQRGCRLLTDLGLCEFGKQEYRIDWKGDFCLERAEPLCTPAEATPPARARLMCMTQALCTVDYYVLPNEPVFEVETASVLDVDARVPGGFEVSDVRSIMVNGGFLIDFVLVGDRVIVSTNDGRFVEDRVCYESAPGLLKIFSRADLSLVGTATAPPCLRGMVASEDELGFLGVYGARTEPLTAALFDLDGREVSRQPLELVDRERHYYDVMQGRRSNRTGDVLMLLRRNELVASTTTAANLLYVIDSRTLDHRLLYERVGSDMTSFDQSPVGTIVFSNDEQDEAIFIDGTNGEFLVKIDVPHFLSASVGEVNYHAPSNELLMIVPIEESAIHLYDPEPRHRRRSVFYEHNFAPLSAAPWPNDQALMLVGGVDRTVPGQPRATIVLFEPVGGRYFPGATPIGFGATSRMKSAADGVYLLLPWEAKLVRVSAAR